jgi:hypothetical protein
MPVASMSALDASKTRRRLKCPPKSPTASVTVAEPTSVPVTIAPTRNGE